MRKSLRNRSSNSSARCKKQRGSNPSLPSRRFAFHARVVRADEARAGRTHADGLCRAEGIGSLECMPAFFKLAQRLFTNALFDNQFVRFPLMVKTRLGQSRRRVHAKIK